MMPLSPGNLAAFLNVLTKYTERNHEVSLTGAQFTVFVDIKKIDSKADALGHILN